MALETKVILKSLLMQVKRAKTVKQAVIAVENVCTKETIADVDKAIAEMDEEESNPKGE